MPVIRNANQLTVAEIPTQAQELTANPLWPTDSGGHGGQHVYDSNLGMMDVENFTAIINPGESAILAVAERGQAARGAQRPNVVTRTIMKMTFS